MLIRKDSQNVAAMSSTHQQSRQKQVSLSQLPLDELKAYARKLGMHFPKEAHQGELLRLIRERQELLLELDRQALLDICVWARRPVRQSASKEELAAEIAAIYKMRFKGLSVRGLYSLCKLRQLKVAPNQNASTMIKALKKAEPWGNYLQRKRRRWMGSLISNLLHSNESREANQEEYQFLPEDKVTLKEQIEENGVVGGLTRKIKGAADDYVREKLDEIEVRIDQKLDQIDRRLSEWRDREIHNRLRIIRITLITMIVVALLSLGYDYVKRNTEKTKTPQTTTNSLR